MYLFDDESEEGHRRTEGGGDSPCPPHLGHFGFQKSIYFFNIRPPVSPPPPLEFLFTPLKGEEVLSNRVVTKSKLATAVLLIFAL